VVAHDRPGERQERQEIVELEIPQSVLADAGVQPGIGGSRSVAVERRAAPERLERPLEVVPSRLGDDVGEPSLSPAEFGRRARRLDLDLLDRLDVELRPELAGERVGGRDAVDQGADVGVPRAMDVRVAVASTSLTPGASVRTSW
jgi:hypothetical protein